MPAPDEHRRHLLLPDRRTDVLAYTYPRNARGKSFRPRSVNPGSHGAKLLTDLRAVRSATDDLTGRRLAAGVSSDQGTLIEFTSAPGFDLALDSLSRRRYGIELVAVRQRQQATLATVLVPKGRLNVFEKLIGVYRTQQTPKGAPKNQKLIANVAAIRLALAESLWTDEGDLPPPDADLWWEVWLRRSASARADFRRLARAQGMRLGERHLEFIDRQVVLSFGSLDQLTASVELLDCVTELRRAKELASFFADLPPDEQGEWVQDLVAQAQPPPPDARALCLLDTGVNRLHPLLTPYIGADDLHTVKPAWRAVDRHGHGTAMAGLGLWGDLAEALAALAPRLPEHRLESVVLRPPGNPRRVAPGLYGSYTAAGIALPEIQAPRRRRVFCMTVATTDGRDHGSPSSWSAEVDTLCQGDRDGQPRLMVLAAGSIRDRSTWRDGLANNDTEQVHDPGQAWNALTIGAYTDKIHLDPEQFPGWHPIAAPGALSPSSTTSVGWRTIWPNKPDLVLEGGNGAVDPAGAVDAPDDLSLLTTWWRPLEKPLSTTGDTSAATALAGRMAATLAARYPDFWPETLRGLLVHSARWTAGMRASVPAGLSEHKRKDVLLRRYGWGVPDLERASYSAGHALTLVAERALRPFKNTALPERAPDIKTRDWHLHRLPWPREALEGMGEQLVSLRVTLSYFIEPSPARKGWTRRHRYQSCGLRFSLKNPDEQIDEFRGRVSKNDQDRVIGRPSFSEPGWALGGLRDRGSIHSDTWSGPTVELASREFIAVYPVSGWWRERPALARWDRSVRYALVISIHSPAGEVDLYTAVATELGIPIEVDA